MADPPATKPKVSPLFQWPAFDPTIPPQAPEALESAAQALWADCLRSYRRPHPRLAPIFEAAPRINVPTPCGAVAAWRLGDGPAVMLMHGFGDDHTLWTPLMEALAAEGTPIVAFDFPGHGLSEGDLNVTRYCVDACLAVADALGPVRALVGHSLGGLVAAQACAEGMEVERVVIISTSNRRARRQFGMAARHGVGADVVARMRQLHAERFGPLDLEGGVPDFARPGLPPALFIHSSDDEVVPVESSQQGVDAWSGAELWVTSGAGHRQTPRQAQVVQRVTAFLRD